MNILVPAVLLGTVWVMGLIGIYRVIRILIYQRHQGASWRWIWHDWKKGTRTVELHLDDALVLDAETSADGSFGIPGDDPRRFIRNPFGQWCVACACLIVPAIVVSLPYLLVVLLRL